MVVVIWSRAPTGDVHIHTIYVHNYMVCSSPYMYIIIWCAVQQILPEGLLTSMLLPQDMI